MPVLVPNKVVSTTKPVLKVDNAFEPGRYLFSLVTVDDGGNKSKPANIAITVEKRRLTPTGPRLRDPAITDAVRVNRGRTIRRPG